LDFNGALGSGGAFAPTLPRAVNPRRCRAPPDFSRDPYFYSHAFYFQVTDHVFFKSYFFFGGWAEPKSPGDLRRLFAECMQLCRKYPPSATNSVRNAFFWIHRRQSKKCNFFAVMMGFLGVLFACTNTRQTATTANDSKYGPGNGGKRVYEDRGFCTFVTFFFPV